MAKLIRKISVGKDYKNDAMHYAVGQEVYGGHTICDIIEEDDKFSVYIKKDKDVLPWKDFNKNMAVSVEYNLEYKIMSTPFKMKGFSGFGNSPMKQDEKCYIDDKGNKVCPQSDKRKVSQESKPKGKDVVVEKPNVTLPNVTVDDKKKQQEIKTFIKKNMNKMSDSKLSKAVREKSDNKTEYNWNTETGEVESHPYKPK